MLRNNLRRLIIGWLLLQLIGCAAPAGDTTPQAVAQPLPQATRALSAPPPTATAAPTATTPPTATPSPLPTATATPVPTPTPIAVRIALPQAWHAALATAASAVPQLALLPLADGDGAADVHIARVVDVPAAALPLAREPLALVVAWSDGRDNVSSAQVADLLNGSDPTVSAVAWRELRADRRALTIDGRPPPAADYPLQLTWVLTATAGAQPYAAQLAPLLQQHAPADRVVHLAAVGDIMLDRALGTQIANGNLDFPFLYVADALRAADLTVGNFESALGAVGTPQPKAYPFRAPAAAAAALAAAGIDIVSLANNHALDYGADGLLEGIRLLQAAGVVPIGAGADAAAARAPHIVTLNGVTLALLAYTHVPVEITGFDTAVWTAGAATPGLAWGVPAEITADVQAARALADVVIVVLHSGYEYVVAPSPPQVAAARAAIDGGAALVIGHHAHILQGVEFYGDGVIAYGLGNFAFEIDGPPETVIMDAWLTADGVRALAFQPAVIQPGGQPAPADAQTAAAVQARLRELTRQLNAQR